MAAPTISNVFQIGIDNAMIQVPQNYTVPANPPSEPNPPSDNPLVLSTTTSATPTIMTDTSQTFVSHFYIGYYLTYLTGPAIGQYLVISDNDTDTVTTLAFSPAPTSTGGDKYNIVLSPAYLSQETNTATTTVKDSVTVYVSAIKGFSNPLTMSFFIRMIDNYLDPDLTPIDATTAPWMGSIGSTQSNWDTVTSTNRKILLTDTTTTGTTRTILQDTLLLLTPNALIGYTLTYLTGPASGQSQTITGNTATTITTAAFLPAPHEPTPSGSDTFEVWLGWTDTLPFVLVPNVTNALNRYAPQNYQTLWINPNGTGGVIDSNHPPSYQVNLYALDPITNTYAACSFTIVVLPSIANYGLGVVETIQGADGNFVYGNSVDLKKSGYHGGTPPQSVAIVNFNFYPLESTSRVPNVAPAPVAISIDWFNNGDPVGIIDLSDSTINGTAIGGYANGSLILLGGFTRDSPSSSVELVIYLNSHASATDGVSTHGRALIQVTGTDTNGVTASAYLIIQVRES